MELPLTNIEKFKCDNVSDMLTNIERKNCGVEQFLLTGEENFYNTTHRCLRYVRVHNDEGITIIFSDNIFDLGWEENYYRITK